MLRRDPDWASFQPCRLPLQGKANEAPNCLSSTWVTILLPAPSIDRTEVFFVPSHADLQAPTR